MGGAHLATVAFCFSWDCNPTTAPSAFCPHYLNDQRAVVVFLLRRSTTHAHTRTHLPKSPLEYFLSKPFNALQYCHKAVRALCFIFRFFIFSYSIFGRFGLREGRGRSVAEWTHEEITLREVEQQQCTDYRRDLCEGHMISTLIPLSDWL